MDKLAAADAIVTSALPHVPFEGWNQAVLFRAAVEADYKKTDVIRVFPGGTIEAVDHFMHMGDRAMETALARYHLDTMKIRERISTAVLLWLEANEQHPEALRKALALEATPFYAHRALKNLYRTVDAIWYAIGDTSTNFNFYTKRLTLAAVFVATCRFWLDDKTPGKTATHDFLARRIEDVMKIEKAKSFVREWFKKIA